VVTTTDRNFDDLAERFAHRVYGGAKGKIRQAVISRDLDAFIPRALATAGLKPLRVLDVGGGLGYFAIKLAALGHTVVFNDLSGVMTAKAQQTAKAVGVYDNITWHTGPYQELNQALPAGHGFDLILCHALLEWLAQPAELIPALRALLLPRGYLSFCFYNPQGMVYRNLIRGNFDWVNQSQHYRANQRSLTPNNAIAIPQVEAWLSASNFTILSEAGIRVFTDYVVDKRGGHQCEDQVLAMELVYSNQAPYMRLGRYIHILAQCNTENK